ncbi:hypothetical protein RR48_10072 [Papilio machaon]|uniref:Uncharacterized protein n=1 Tax=Papilio machaon TaxID=76193 RepID=A0A194QZL1_PAPMA|nr:hypothetical protein RR48_10072 [Papilio machaon]
MTSRKTSFESPHTGDVGTVAITAGLPNGSFSASKELTVRRDKVSAKLVATALDWMIAGLAAVEYTTSVVGRQVAGAAMTLVPLKAWPKTA